MKIAQFLKEVRREMDKVTWPSRQEIIKMTSLVIIVSFAVGVYIGVIDVAFAKMMETIVK